MRFHCTISHLCPKMIDFMQWIVVSVLKKRNIYLPCAQCSSFYTHIGTLNSQVVMNVKSFIAKRVISILVNLRYLRFKLLKYKENNKKICDTSDHNFRYIPLCIMS